MGRARLEMKYREDRRARTSTYLNRVRGAKKKAYELSTLCGVDVLFVSSMELKSFDVWPEDINEARRVAARYLQPSMIKVLPKTKKARENRGTVEPNPSPPIHRDIASIDAKSQEVMARIRFLEAAKTSPPPLAVVDDEPMLGRNGFDASALDISVDDYLLDSISMTPLTPAQTISMDELSPAPVLLDDEGDIFSALGILDAMTPPPISCSPMISSSLDDWYRADTFDDSSSFGFLPVCSHFMGWN